VERDLPRLVAALAPAAAPDVSEAAILARARAAHRLGELGKRRPEVVSALTDLVRRRTPHPDWRYHGLDGATAARSLGLLGAREASASLGEALFRVDTSLTAFGDYPPAWTDWRLKRSALLALGELRSEEGKRLLQQYLAMDPEESRELGPPLHGEAVRALLLHSLSQQEIEGLLSSRHPAARGAAILECLDAPTRARSRALRVAAPWALDLPRRVHPARRATPGSGGR
jgi:hypothetical protein